MYYVIHVPTHLKALLPHCLLNKLMTDDIQDLRGKSFPGNGGYSGLRQLDGIGMVKNLPIINRCGSVIVNNRC